MELLEAVWAVVEGLLFFIDVAAAVADLIAFFKSIDNLRERREARRSGTSPPPRTKWTWLVVLLTPLVISITVWIVIKRL